MPPKLENALNNTAILLGGRAYYDGNIYINWRRFDKIETAILSGGSYVDLYFYSSDESVIDYDGSVRGRGECTVTIELYLIVPDKGYETNKASKSFKVTVV